MNTRSANFPGVVCALAGSLLALTFPVIAADEAKPKPISLPGIHNAFRVTARILAGSQPEGDAAFAALAKAGVKTIISVDGARPDVEAAKKHGLRYVHLPFGYDGISTQRIAELTKAAAPEAGTIFIHCHHGKHRGPAAVGVVCEAVAGWTPAQADAWMKQAGTAPDYPGLYRAVREFHAPSPEEIARIGALPATAKTPALVNAMVAIDERFDALKSAQTAGWKTPEAEAETPHPRTKPRCCGNSSANSRAPRKWQNAPMIFASCSPTRNTPPPRCATPSALHPATPRNSTPH